MEKDKKVEVIKPTPTVVCCQCKFYVRPVCNKNGKFTRRKATCSAAEKK